MPTDWRNAGFATQVAAIHPDQRMVLDQRQGKYPEHQLRELPPVRVEQLYLSSMLHSANKDAREQLRVRWQEIKDCPPALLDRYAVYFRKVLDRVLGSFAA